MVWVLIFALAAGLTYWLFMSPHSQTFGKFIYRSKTGQKLVALTFDDGPNEPYTSQLLDYFSVNKVEATFFVVGSNALRQPKTVIKTYERGHTVGNHSLSHQFRKYFTQPGYKEEIIDTQKIISHLIGKEPALFRPPWLWRQPMMFSNLRKLGLIPISGDFGDPLEPFGSPAKTMVRRTISKVKPGSIIIFHDGFNAKGANRAQTVEAVKLVVEDLSKKGYRFVTVDELLGVKAYK